MTAVLNFTVTSSRYTGEGPPETLIETTTVHFHVSDEIGQKLTQLFQSINKKYWQRTIDKTMAVPIPQELMASWKKSVQSFAIAPGELGTFLHKVIADINP